MNKDIKQFVKTYIDEVPTKSLIIDKLKNALREEFNAWYGYIITREFLTGTLRPDIVKTYDELAEDELKDHAYWLMKRINELGGTIEDITLSPNSWDEAKHEYRTPIWLEVEDKNIIPVIQSLKTNIENEKDAIETYNELIALTQNVDWTTNAKCKEILADEEEHLQMLTELLDDIQFGICQFNYLKESLDLNNIPFDACLDNPEILKDEPVYTSYDYFGNCVNTVNIDKMWDATQMYNWINTCKVISPLYVINKLNDGDRKIPKILLNIIQKLKNQDLLEDTSEIVCAIDNDQKIMFIYLTQTDKHYFFDCKY